MASLPEDNYKNANNRLILLDYDGTLVEHASMPEAAIPTNKLLDVLARLSQKPDCKLMVISGRNQEDMDNFIGLLPIDIIAEHGALLKSNGRWMARVSENESWKIPVLSTMRQAIESTPGSFIEQKKYSIAWHYRNAETETGNFQSRALIRILKKYLERYNLKLLDGDLVIEILPAEIGKGKAVRQLIGKINYDYILCIGNDITDEEMFKILAPNPNAHTIKVGEGNTFAKYKLNSTEDVISLLDRLTKIE